MKLKTIREAEADLHDLILQAREETIGLTDDEGNLLGLLAGIDDDDLDDLMVETPGFNQMIARSRASLETGPAISAEDLLEEFRAKQSEEASDSSRVVSVELYAGASTNGAGRGGAGRRGG